MPTSDARAMVRRMGESKPNDDTRSMHFVGGPLDGQQIDVDRSAVCYVANDDDPGKYIPETPSTMKYVPPATPKTKPKFKVGSVVRLKHGKRLFTVVRVVEFLTSWKIEVIDEELLHTTLLEDVFRTGVAPR